MYINLICGFVKVNMLFIEPEPVSRRSPSPQTEESGNPELDRYLNRSYWESIQSNEPKDMR